MGAPVTRMTIAPLNRAQARWLRGLVGYADEIIAAHDPDPRDNGDGYRDLIAALDVGRRALAEYDSRPWRQRVTAPRPASASEASVKVWADHLQAFMRSRPLFAEADADTSTAE
jgi:hypothetical protein